MNDVIYERYKELACAVIQQIVDDYINLDKSDMWLMLSLEHCVMFDYVDLDYQYIYEKSIDLKKKLKEKKIKRRKKDRRRTLNG